MTIGLFRFPLLVYSSIVKQMDLIETIALTSTSKNSHAKVRVCLAYQKLQLKYKVNHKFKLTRKCSDGTVRDKLTIRLVDHSDQKLVYSYLFWKLLDQYSVPIRFVEKPATVMLLSYWPNRLEVMNPMLKFIMDLFPNLILDLFYSILRPGAFQTTMEIVKDVELRKVEVNKHTNRICDDLVKLALEKCGGAKTLVIYRKTSDAFEYDYETHPPFTFDRLQMESAGWVTKDHFLKLFLTCKRMTLNAKAFEDEELKTIFETWVEGSPMEFMNTTGSPRFYRGKTLTDVVGYLPGAQAVEKASIIVTLVPELTYEVARFREGRCYQIQQNSGKKALVYQYNDAIFFSVFFQIGEDVDKMPVENEEEDDDDDEDEEEEGENVGRNRNFREVPSDEESAEEHDSDDWRRF